MIAIVDYGLGNVNSFLNIYRALGIPASSATNASQISNASHIIIPGVGSFDAAINSLNNSGMREALDKVASNKQKPILGVCVGLQMMLERSEEGLLPGLGWFKGTVGKLKNKHTDTLFHLPHMGWNSVLPVDCNDLFNRIDEHVGFYFLHSFYVDPVDHGSHLALCKYGQTFACALRKSKIFGVQFHPEKSHKNGVQLLKNFASI